MFRLSCGFDQKIGLCLTTASILLKIRFGHTQISVPISVYRCRKQPVSAPEYLQP